jgi:pimeloyl-ACP methyl ester carboxylesterase
MAQIAASIEHEAALPPSGLPDDMQALPGATLRFLSIKAIDGFKIQAALWQPDNKPPAETTIIVQVHGSGGNLASLPLRVIARALSAGGYAGLSISTRQHDEHVNTDNFFDVRRDIEAAVVTAKTFGYRSIVLQGHSLGTVQVAFYAASDWDHTIKGVILTGAFGKLPWKSRHILIEDEERYRALAVAWREALKAGTAAEVLPIKMRWLGGVETPVTPQHFLTYKDVIGKAVTRPKPVERSTRICLSIYRGTAATLGFAKAAVSSPWAHNVLT